MIVEPFGLRMDQVVFVTGTPDDLAIGYRCPPCNAAFVEPFLLQQRRRQGLQLIGIGDGKDLEERRNRANACHQCLKSSDVRRALLLDLAGVFVDDQRRLRFQLAIAQRIGRD